MLCNRRTKRHTDRRTDNYGWIDCQCMYDLNYHTYIYIMKKPSAGTGAFIQTDGYAYGIYYKNESIFNNLLPSS